VLASPWYDEKGHLIGEYDGSGNLIGASKAGRAGASGGSLQSRCRRDGCDVGKLERGGARAALRSLIGTISVFEKAGKLYGRIGIHATLST